MSEPTERDRELARLAKWEMYEKDDVNQTDWPTWLTLVAKQCATARAEGKAEACKRIREWAVDDLNCFAHDGTPWDDQGPGLLALLDEIEAEKAP